MTNTNNKICSIIKDKKNKLLKNNNPKADDNNVITDKSGIAILTDKGKEWLCNKFSYSTVIKYFIDGTYTKVRHKINNENDAIIKTTKHESGKVDMMSINEHDIKHIQGMIDSSLVPVYTRLDNIDTRLDNMEKKFDKKFDDMEKKFDKKFNDMNNQIIDINDNIKLILQNLTDTNNKSV